MEKAMHQELESFDVVIIGGGPAGIAGAIEASNAGYKVALVDAQAELGGAGVNTGTVPSKTLRETAVALSGMRSRNLHGVDLSLRREVTVTDFLRHERNVKAGLNTMLTERLQASSATIIHGYGAFEGPHVLGVRGRDGGFRHLRGERILIATGSSPVRPTTFSFESPGIYDSDTILSLDRLPKSMAVIGGGVIGSEYACTFAALGAEVHLIDGRNTILPFLDGEISRALAAAMERGGVRIHWNERASSSSAAAFEQTRLQLSSEASLTVDAVLVAAGRTSNTQTLNLHAAGLTASERGLIGVDEHFRTCVPHIYAAGDVIGFPALASTSVQQGRIAMRHALGAEGASSTPRLLPVGVYTIPEVGMVGDTEEALQQQGVEYVIGRGPYRGSSRGRIIGDGDGFLKLLFRRNDGTLLGVHAIGEQAAELVHIGMIAMMSGATMQLFDNSCFNMPTLGELYKLATLDALLRMRSGRSLTDDLFRAVAPAA